MPWCGDSVMRPDASVSDWSSDHHLQANSRKETFLCDIDISLQDFGLPIVRETALHLVDAIPSHRIKATSRGTTSTDHICYDWTFKPIEGILPDGRRILGTEIQLKTDVQFSIVPLALFWDTIDQKVLKNILDCLEKELLHARSKKKNEDLLS